MGVMDELGDKTDEELEKMQEKTDKIIAEHKDPTPQQPQQ